MRILFITDNFPPEVNAPATRTYEHCQEWLKQGVEVTVITCAPNFPKGKVYDGYKNKIRQEEMMNGIRVIRVWSYITANEGFAKRILDFMSFGFMAFWAGLFVKTDVIIATSPQFFTTPSAWLLSVFKRKPWVFEVRDLWPESIKAVSAMSESSRIYRSLERLEMFLYRRADQIITVTEAFKKNITGRGIDEKKIHVIKNGANLELFQPKDKCTEVLKEHNLEGKFIVGYIGTHGMAHKLDFFLDFIKETEEDNIHFLFMGEGAEKQKLLKIASDRNIKNVLFLDNVSKEKVIDYVSIVDVALVHLKRSDTFKTVIPSKIFESAAMKKPILLGVEGESKEIIENFNAGLCFIPENKESFLNCLYEMKDDTLLYHEFQKGCEELVKEFDRKKLAAKMLSHLKELN
ncbi:MAG: glycosyltransferase family 4 protein [Flavobacteriales bacterium]